MKPDAGLNLTRSLDGAKNDQPFSRAHYPLSIMASIRSSCTGAMAGGYLDPGSVCIRVLILKDLLALGENRVMNALQPIALGKNKRLD